MELIALGGNYNLEKNMPDHPVNLSIIFSD